MQPASDTIFGVAFSRLETIAILAGCGTLFIILVLVIMILSVCLCCKNRQLGRFVIVPL